MDNLKVVIIDDNEVIVNSLLATIDWGRFSCEVAGVAYDGKAGQKLIEDTKPDIIISDIRLPFCDGIDMIKNVYHIAKNAKTILISGYSDFEYAKRGIKINVFDYILKPIDTKDLNKTLESAAKELLEERSNASKIQGYKETRKYIKELSESNKIMAKRLALMSILSLSDSTAQKEIENLFRRGKEEYKAFVIMISSVSECKNSLKNVFADFTKRVMPATDNEEIITLRMGNNIITLVLFLNKLPNIVKQYGIKVYDRLRMASQDAKAGILTVSSELYTDPDMLYNAYIKVSLIMQKEMLKKENNKTYYAGDYSDLNDINYISLISRSEELSSRLDYIDANEIKMQLDNYIFNCVNEGNNNSSLIKLMLTDILFTYIKKNNMQHVFLTNDKINKAINDFAESEFKITDTTNLVDLFEELKNFKEQNEGCSALVKSAIQYIHECPLENLTLSYVAEHLEVSPAYLSRVIKKEKDCSFMEIVREIKMKKAKKLLEDLTNSVEDVAHQIGYTSYLGFLKAFKSSEGITPQEYRNNL